MDLFSISIVASSHLLLSTETCSFPKFYILILKGCGNSRRRWEDIIKNGFRILKRSVCIRCIHVIHDRDMTRDFVKKVMNPVFQKMREKSWMAVRWLLLNKNTNTKHFESLSSCSQVFRADGGTDGKMVRWSHMMKLTIAFRNFAKAPKTG